MKQYLKKYKERIKTIVLITLVFVSIGQTTYYWLSSAYSTETTENNYRIPPQFGTKEFNEKKPSQLAEPPITYLHNESVIGFLSANLPSANSSGLETYQKLMQTISQTQIMNVQPINPSVEEWNKILKQPGVEFQYHHAVQLEQVSTFFKWKYSNQGISTTQEVDRVWMTVPNTQGVAQVYMISTRSPHPGVYIGFTTLSGKELVSLIRSAMPLTSYKVTPIYSSTSNALFPNGNLYYLPSEPVRFDQLTYKVSQIEIQQMKEALFEDPTLQPIKPREGWEIYVYGSRRTLLYDSIRKEMQYSGQAIDANSNTASTDLQLAIKNTNDFLHKHFGWTGDFHLDSFSTDPNDDMKQLKFRQYESGIPIYWGTNEDSLSELPPTIIRMKPYITTNNQNVVEDASFYHRSLYYWQPNAVGKKQVTLPGASDLEQALKKHQIPTALIEQVQLVYLAAWDSSKKESVTMKPYWKIVVTGDGVSYPIKEKIFYVGEGGQWIGEERKQY